VAHLGKRVVCQHCLAEFEACDPAGSPYCPEEPSRDLLSRAEELLSTASRKLEFLDD
jgi:hypothetical protein